MIISAKILNKLLAEEGRAIKVAAERAQHSHVPKGNGKIASNYKKTIILGFFILAKSTQHIGKHSFSKNSWTPGKKIWAGGASSPLLKPSSSVVQGDSFDLDQAYNHPTL